MNTKGKRKNNGLVNKSSSVEVVDLTYKAFLAMSEFVEDYTGTCPLDMFDWDHPKGCADVCDNVTARCWRKYFLEKAKEKHNDVNEDT